ncbi:hypothetical protein HNS03_08370 [Amorphus sp. 3PC139-8]
MARDLRAGTYDAVAARFAALWPADVEWPSDIDRPEPAEVEEDTLVLVTRRLRSRAHGSNVAAIHPDWPDGHPWPNDIPLPPQKGSRNGA